MVSLVQFLQNNSEAELKMKPLIIMRGYEGSVCETYNLSAAFKAFRKVIYFRQPQLVKELDERRIIKTKHGESDGSACLFDVHG